MAAPPPHRAVPGPRRARALGPVLALGLAACASGERGSAARPDWIDRPAARCGAEALCAVGEGASRREAELAGREGIAKVFATEVRSDATATLSDRDGGSFSRVARESTELLLTGARVEERFAEGGRRFALVSLDRAAAAAAVLGRIGDLDDRIRALRRRGGRASLREAVRLHGERRALEARRLVLRPRAAPPPPAVPLADLLGALDGPAGRAPTVLLEDGDGDGDGGDGPLRGLLVRELLDRGHPVVTDRRRPFDYEVRVESAIMEGHLNVRGFRRRSVSLAVTGLDRDGAATGRIEVEAQGTGRTGEAALREARARLAPALREAMGGLGLDGGGGGGP